MTGSRQAARVISGGTTATGITQAATVSSYARGATFGSQPLVSGMTLAPRTVVSGTTIVTGARPAKVISGGTTITGQGNPRAGMKSQAAYEKKHRGDPQLANLKELKQVCGLQNVEVNHATQLFKSVAVNDQLTKAQFLECYDSLLHESQTTVDAGGRICRVEIELPSKAVQDAVFDLFDRDDNGVVDMMELICGTSLLCTGTEEEKIHAIFDVFDENGDGFVSMEEMVKFLTAVFKVVLTPNVMDVLSSQGNNVESPEHLAETTAWECFQTSDLNHDGKLSVEEFKYWFFAPRNDPTFMFSPVRKMMQ